jgi:hypothetical protein
MQALGKLAHFLSGPGIDAWSMIGTHARKPYPFWSVVRWPDLMSKANVEKRFVSLQSVFRKTFQKRDIFNFF